MSWSFPIGTVKGTVIRLHVTFLLFLVWIAGAHYVQGGQRAALEHAAQRPPFARGGERGQQAAPRPSQEGQGVHGRDSGFGWMGFQ